MTTNDSNILDILGASFYSTFRMIAISVSGALFVKYKV